MLIWNTRPEDPGLNDPNAESHELPASAPFEGRGRVPHPEASAVAYRAMLDRLDVERGVIVQPSLTTGLLSRTWVWSAPAAWQ